MTMLTIAERPVRPRPRAVSLADFRAAEPRFFDFGLLMLALMPPTAFAAMVDPRLTNGIGVWDKPLKFQFSLAVYLLTLVLFARFMPGTLRGRLWYRVFSFAVVAAVIVEMLWLMGAAYQGIPSHFNPTPVGTAIYMAMGAAAVFLTSATTVQAVAIARHPSLQISPALRESMVSGLGLTLPLTLISAGILASGQGHWVGGVQDDSGGLALMGWARDGGDLRVAHFFGTHAMQFIPAFGLVSAWLLGADKLTPVRVFTAAYALLVLFTLWQALAGRPFLPMLG